MFTIEISTCKNSLPQLNQRGIDKKYMAKLLYIGYSELKACLVHLRSRTRLNSK